MFRKSHETKKQTFRVIYLPSRRGLPPRLMVKGHLQHHASLCLSLYVLLPTFTYLSIVYVSFCNTLFVSPYLPMCVLLPTLTYLSIVYVSFCTTLFVSPSLPMRMLQPTFSYLSIVCVSVCTTLFVSTYVYVTVYVYLSVYYRKAFLRLSMFLFALIST